MKLRHKGRFLVWCIYGKILASALIFLLAISHRLVTCLLKVNFLSSLQQEDFENMSFLVCKQVVKTLYLFRDTIKNDIYLN